MGWNRQNEVGRVAPRPPHGKVLLFGLVAGSVVVLGAIGTWWFLSDSGCRGATRPTERKIGLIREVTPSAAPTNAPAASVPARKKYKDMTREEKLAFLQREFGDNPPDNYKAEIYFLKHPPKENIRPYGDSPINAFKNRSERAIASALMMDPGAPMLLKPTFDASLDADFAQHAVDAIEIGEDDTDEVRALKQAVSDTKKELIARVKNGEKPSDILNAHMDSMYELGKYKSQMTELINEMRNDPSKSDDDVRDFVTAANQLLREKGAREFDMPNLFARQAKLRAMARKASKRKGNGK